MRIGDVYTYDKDAYLANRSLVVIGLSDYGDYRQYRRDPRAIESIIDSIDYVCIRDIIDSEQVIVDGIIDMNKKQFAPFGIMPIVTLRNFITSMKSETESYKRLEEDISCLTSGLTDLSCLREDNLFTESENKELNYIVERLRSLRNNINNRLNE